MRTSIKSIRPLIGHLGLITTPSPIMLLLLQLATQVVNNWDHGDLAASVRALGEHLAEIQADRNQHQSSIAFAREHYALPSDDDIEIDDAPLTSASHEGVWINAWLWVDHDQVSVPCQTNDGKDTTTPTG